jgi:hypothetical protein
VSAEEMKIDKSSWGPGPWQDEPDRLEWKHAGLSCLIVRAQPGHLCGYVAVPPGHPWHGVDYSGRYDENGESYTPSPIDVDVHGGLTYAEKCQGKICHVPAPGDPDDVWWLGFDCAHLGDTSPKREAEDRGRGWFDPMASYKSVPYVRREVERLAEQVAATKETT